MHTYICINVSIMICYFVTFFPFFLFIYTSIRSIYITMLSHLKKLGDPINNTIISFYLKRFFSTRLYFRRIGERDANAPRGRWFIKSSNNKYIFSAPFDDIRSQTVDYIFRDMNI